MGVRSCAASHFEVNRDDLYPAGELVSKALDLHLALEVGRVRRLSLMPVDVIEEHGDLPRWHALSPPTPCGQRRRWNAVEDLARERQPASGGVWPPHHNR